MARAMQPLPDDDTPPPSWRQRPRPIGFEIAYKLDGDALEIDTTRKVERVRLSAIEQVLSPRGIQYHTRPAGSDMKPLGKL